MGSRPLPSILARVSCPERLGGRSTFVPACSESSRLRGNRLETRTAPAGRPRSGAAARVAHAEHAIRRSRSGSSPRMNSRSFVHAASSIFTRLRRRRTVVKSATIASSTVKSLFTDLAARRPAAPGARVALRRRTSRRSCERAARPKSDAAEAGRVEALDRTVEALVGFDAAAAVDLAAAVGELQLVGGVRARSSWSRSV